MDDYGFKFKIGDWVRPIGMPKPGYPRDFGLRCIVVGRLLEECEGGIQRHYSCAEANAQGSTGMVRLPELVLELSQPFSADPLPGKEVATH